jgi:hypothetical protein
LFHKISFISPTASQGGEKEPKRSLGGVANKEYTFFETEPEKS